MKTKASTSETCFLAFIYFQTISAIPLVCIMASIPWFLPYEAISIPYLPTFHVVASLAPWIGSILYHLFMNHEKGYSVYEAVLTIDLLGIWTTQTTGKRKKKKYWFYISSSGSRLLNHHSTLDGWGKDIFVKEYTCEYNKEKVDILRMGKRTFHLVMYLVYGLTLYFIWHFMYIFILCAGGLITICATIYCFDNELQEQLLTAYGFLCLYCLYKVS